MHRQYKWKERRLRLYLIEKDLKRFSSQSNQVQFDYGFGWKPLCPGEPP